MLHSFREGNTRTQGVFFSRLAAHVGYRLDTSRFAVGRTGARDEFVNARFYAMATGRHDRLAAVLDPAVTRL